MAMARGQTLASPLVSGGGNVNSVGELHSKWRENVILPTRENARAPANQGAGRADVWIRPPPPTSGLTWRYSYNGYQQVTSVTDPAGNTTFNNYDNNGNLLSTTLPSRMELLRDRPRRSLTTPMES